jgi:hypothetical protein
MSLTIPVSPALQTKKRGAAAIAVAEEEVRPPMWSISLVRLGVCDFQTRTTPRGEHRLRCMQAAQWAEAVATQHEFKARPLPTFLCAPW